MRIAGLEPMTSCVWGRGDYDSTTETQVAEQILFWTQFKLWLFLRFSEFAEFTDFNERSAPFRKNSNGTCRDAFYSP